MKKIQTITLSVAILMMFGYLGQAFAYTEQWEPPANFWPPNLYYYLAVDDSGSWTTFPYLDKYAEEDSYFEDISNGSGSDIFNGNNFEGWCRWSKQITYGAHKNWVEKLTITFESLSGVKQTGDSCTQSIHKSGSGTWTGSFGDTLYDTQGTPYPRKTFSCGGIWAGTFHYGDTPLTASGSTAVTWPADTLLSDTASWEMTRNSCR